MTVTKCAECPFFNALEKFCFHDVFTKGGFFMHLKNIDEIHQSCPIAQGKPFTISFTPINDENEKEFTIMDGESPVG